MYPIDEGRRARVRGWGFAWWLLLAQNGSCGARLLLVAFICTGSYSRSLNKLRSCDILTISDLPGHRPLKALTHGKRAINRSYVPIRPRFLT